ncbi:MAG: DUF3853 family protein [Bacteroidales bacterium]
MIKQDFDLNKPAFTLTVRELLNLISENLPQNIEIKNSEPRQPIKGIHALAKYLGVCPAKAQSLKNSGVLPYFQNGRIVLFDCDKVDEVMQSMKKVK